jgi:hypothetical protein
MSALSRSARGAPGLRPQRRCRASLECLEARALLAGAAPTDAEQYMLELINRARANPAAEGQRLLALAQTDPVIHQATAGWDLGLFSRTISSYAPEPPLAFNPRLIDAALAEDASMLARNSQQHSPGGFLNNPAVAVDTDGQAYYPTGAGWWSTGENIFAFSRNVNVTSPTSNVDYFEAGFLLDWGVSDFGHLKNLLAPGPAGANPSAGVFPFNEVGVGLLDGTPTTPPGSSPPNAGINVGPELVTQEFGWRQGNAFLTGTFYGDGAGDHFYRPGEGVGGVTITAVGTSGQGTFRAQTWPSGGYSLQLPPGTYQVSATGNVPGAPSTTVTIGLDNVSWEMGVIPAPQADIPVPADYDGIGRAEFATYRPSTGLWSISNPSTGTRVQQFGMPGDIPVPGRYDGGSKDEIAVYRPSIGTWFILGPDGVRVAPWGVPGDVPVPGDYDGDGKTDLAVYRPTIGTWFLQDSRTRTVQVIPWGIANLDQPVQAAYEGSGFTEIAVLRPTTFQWFLITSTGVRVVQFGGPGFVPAPAPYDGRGVAEVAVYQPSSSTFFVANSGVRQVVGTPGLGQPVTGDFDGDGKADLAVFQATTARWSVDASKGGTIQVNYGWAGAGRTLLGLASTTIPVPVAWLPRIAVPGAEALGGFGPIPIPQAPPTSIVPPRWRPMLSKPSRPSVGPGLIAS